MLFCGSVDADPLSDRIAVNNQAVASADFRVAVAEAPELVNDCEKAYGVEDPRTLSVRINWATAEQATVNYIAADRQYRRCLAALTGKSGREASVMRALILNLQSALYQTTGQYHLAEKASREAVTIRTEVYGEESPETMKAKTNLGAVTWHLGSYVESASLFDEITRFFRKTGDQEKLGQALVNLGGVYCDAENYESSRKALMESLELRRKFQAGTVHHASSLQYLGEMQTNNGDYAAAVRTLKEALAIRRRLMGDAHPKVAETLTQYGAALFGAGDRQQAETCFEESVVILEKSLGATHSDLQRPLEYLAVIAKAKGESGRALQFSRRAAVVAKKTLANVMMFASEHERLTFIRRAHPFDSPATLEDPAGSAEALVSWKGAVLDSVLEDWRLASGMGDDLMASDRIHSSRDRLRLLQSGDGTAAPAAEVEKERESLERELASFASQHGAVRSFLTKKPRDIQNLLTNGEVYLDYFRYRHLGSRKNGEDHYAVLCFTTRDLRFVDLGPADAIDQKIARMRSLILEFNSGNDGKLTDVAQDLFSMLIAKPTGSSIPANLILCPDGNLNFLPFACLIGPDKKMLAETSRLRFVTCARDLLKSQASSRALKQAILIGNPDFQMESSGAAEKKEQARGSPGARDYRFAFGNPSLEQLPGTSEEIDGVKQHLQRAGWKIQTRVNQEASEASVRNLHGATVIHYATHAFCSGDSSSDVPPLMRSWLALAGANRSLRLIQAGRFIPPDSDGLLTAAEVVQLPLRDTSLVVLSACETGMGEIAVGEGILGLRRAFAIAGAGNLLVTLWPIDDLRTVTFMTDFYRCLAEGKPVTEAFHATQRAQLLQLGKQEGFSKAAYWAAGFLLVSSGHQ